MGAWGTGIFANDTAADVRARFREKLDDGMSPTAARRALLQGFKPALADSDDGPVIWLALAATQLECHCLEELVRTKALAIIDAGGDLERWRASGKPSLVRGRQAALARLRTKLAQPRPKAKTPARPRPRAKGKRFVESKANFPLGEVFAYRLGSGDYVLLHLVDYSGNSKFGFQPIFALLDWRGADLPAADEVRAIRLKTGDDSGRGPDWPWMIEVCRKREEDLPADRVVRLGVLRDRHCAKVDGGYQVGFWDTLDRNFQYSLGWK
jgi:hypothetical protein